MTIFGFRFFGYHAIGDPVFLRRWILLGWPWGGGIYLHQFVRSDHDRACHDHPWNFLAIVLWGGYWERYLDPSKLNPHRRDEWQGWRRPGSILWRPAIWRHRIELEDGRPSWSVVFAGRRRQPWGFWVPEVDGRLTWCWWRHYNTGTGICEDRVLHEEGED